MMVQHTCRGLKSLELSWSQDSLTSGTSWNIGPLMTNLQFFHGGESDRSFVAVLFESWPNIGLRLLVEARNLFDINL